MDWVIETTGGIFEGEKLTEAVSTVVEHYGDEDESPSQITDIYAYDKNDIERHICQKGIGRINTLVEERVEAWRQESREGEEAQKDLESDYYSNLL